VPSWLKPAEEEPPAPANDQAANDDQPETFKLKVLGNELSVTFDELAKQAGLEPDEAKDLPKASLIRLAQKNAAADAYLDEAKATVKSARTARAPGDTQPEAERTTTPVRKEADPSGEPNDGEDEADQPDEYADIVKEIQFGDEKEAAKQAPRRRRAGGPSNQRSQTSSASSTRPFSATLELPSQPSKPPTRTSFPILTSARSSTGATWSTR
jgi:hypothetical protein